MKLKLVLLSIAASLTTVSFAQEESAENSTSKQGVEFNFEGEMTSEFQWNFNDKVNWVNLLALNLELSPWEGGALQLQTNHTVKTHETIIDDYQGFSNIEEDNLFCAIMVLDYFQEFGDDDLGFDFAVGVRNMNEDFFVSDIASFFTSSSPGILPTISASYDIANYPVASLGLHLDFKFSGFTLSNSFYNGVGHNGWTSDDNPFIFRPKEEGIFDALQLAYENEDSGTSAFAGACFHTRQFDGDAEIIAEKSTCAWWLYLEQQLCANDKNYLSLMAQYSENTNKDNECYRYAELGFVGGFNDRNTVGLSYQFAQFQESDEHSLELSWNSQINDVVSLQPTAMYIHNDNGDYGILSMRLILSF